MATATCVLPAEAKEPSAGQLLERVVGARDAHYRARQLVVSFGDDARESAAVLDVRSSRQGRFVRAESGRDVTRLWSRQGMGVVEGDSVAKHEGGVTHVDVSADSVMQKYAVDVAAPVEILGVEVIPLTLVRRRDDRIAERWWVHPSSGVVYRRELFDRDGDLVGMATLIDMWWGDPGPAEPVAAEVRRAPAAERIEAEDAPSHLAGSYELWHAYALEVDDRPSEQWIYSDGLHALSVFRTDGALKTPAGFTATEAGGKRLWIGPGPGTWAWEGDGHSYVVVAEEAGLDVAEMIEPFPRGGRSLWERFGSVWSRLFRGIASLFD
jgi:hypothetical protein